MHTVYNVQLAHLVFTVSDLRKKWIVSEFIYFLYVLIIKRYNLMRCNYRAREAGESRVQPICVGVEQRGAAAELSQSLRWLPERIHHRNKPPPPTECPRSQMQLKIHKASMLHGECRASRHEPQVLANLNVRQRAFGACF